METKDIQEALARYTHEYSITLAVLYGSRARGTPRADSDIDIAFLANPHLATARLAELQTVLTEALGLRVDLMDIADAPPLLLRQIATEGKPLYEATPGMFAETRVHAMMLYFDAKPLLNLRKHLTLTPHHT